MNRPTRQCTIWTVRSDPIFSSFCSFGQWNFIFSRQKSSSNFFNSCLSFGLFSTAACSAVRAALLSSSGLNFKARLITASLGASLQFQRLRRFFSLVENSVFLQEAVVVVVRASFSPVFVLLLAKASHETKFSNTATVSFFSFTAEMLKVSNNKLVKTRWIFKLQTV